MSNYLLNYLLYCLKFLYILILHNCVQIPRNVERCETLEQNITFVWFVLQYYI